MHGACRVSRNQEWRYYVCRKCRSSSVRADNAERLVVEAVKTMTLPPKAIDTAAGPGSRAKASGSLCRSRWGEAPSARNRLVKLPTLYSWGDLSDEDHRRLGGGRPVGGPAASNPSAQREIRADRCRRLDGPFIALATAGRRCLLVERFETRERSVIVSVPRTRCGRPSTLLARGYWRPRTDSGPGYPHRGSARMVRKCRLTPGSPDFRADPLADSIASADLLADAEGPAESHLASRRA